MQSFFQLSESAKRTATCAVFAKDEKRGWLVLLAKRKYDPEAGKWALPGGHINPGESVEAGCSRELEEETSIKTNDLTSVQQRGQDVLFFTVVKSDVEAKAGSDIEDVKWVEIGRLPELAFSHEKCVYAALSKMMGSPLTVD